MAHVALAECIVEEDLLTSFCHVSFQQKWQGEISLTPQGKLKRL
jgi:hypothetical protein